MICRTIWCVSDGRAGIERQTLAVADALSELIEVNTRTMRLNPVGPQTWLPPQFWPAPLMALPPDQRAALTSHLPDVWPDGWPDIWPDIWIANGRRSIPYSLRAKAWSDGKTFVVQLQNPRVDPARFDLVVPPRHDRVTGSNVIETLGAPVWFTKTQIAAAQTKFPALAGITATKILVVLGGPSKRHRFGLERARALISNLEALAKTGVYLMITTSRRTPDNVTSAFRAFARAHNASFFANEAEDGANPYLAWLAQADIALVTEDSTNMMTDAAFFGVPIYLLRLEGRDDRFDRLHAGFIAAGAARWFDGHLDFWTYPPIRDAMVAARAIASRLTSATI